ncbi:hypothetical protein RRG08_000674, partial [Elysia crispata]
MPNVTVREGTTCQDATCNSAKRDNTVKMPHVTVRIGVNTVKMP